MAYEVIDEDLKVEACEVGDLTLSQIESFLRLRGDGEKIETLTLFSRQDGTIELKKNHPGYKDFKDFTLSYLQLEDSEREKLDQLEGIKEAAAVIDRAIEQASDYGHSVEREVGFLAVHGYLHLCGYDHMTEEDKKVMRALEEEILNEYDITR